MIDEILPDVYDITLETDNGRRYRVYLTTFDVPTLIDTGFERTTEALFAAVDEIGVEPERLIITHGDPDHIGGFDAVVEEYDIETWVSEQADTTDIVEPDRRFSDGEAIGAFETIYAPGHERDSYALVAERQGVLIAGDALVGADLRGLPEGYLIPPPALYSEDINQAEESIEGLLEYEFDAVLVFHGSSVTEEADDRVDSFINFPGKPEGASYQ